MNTNYRKNVKHILFYTATVAVGVVLFCGCKPLRDVKTLQACEFEFVSVADFEYAGVQFGNIRSINDIGAEQATRITAAATAKTDKISFTVTVKITNQSASWMSVDGMKWILYRDDRKLLDGNLPTPFFIEPYCSAEMLLPANRTPSLRGKTAPLQQIFNYYRHIMGSGEGDPPHLTLKIKSLVNKTELPYIILKLN